MKQTLENITTSRGRTVLMASFESPVLLVFLRHFGCAFCRESLKDLAQRKKEFSDKGIQLILVHMSDNETANLFFKKMSLSGVEHVSDVTSKYYSAFGLVKASFSQLFGLNTLVRGFGSGAYLGRYGMGNIVGDAFQMPGIFTIFQGELVHSFKHKYISDRPDYDQLATCCSSKIIQNI